MGSDAEIRAMVERNLPLVNHIVFQVAVHFPRHVERDELARAGALGLVEAAKRFQADKGVPFERFAAQRIRGAIIDSVRSSDWAPRSVRNLARRMDLIEQRLATELGRLPSLAEMATGLGLSAEELRRFQDRLFRSVVLAFDQLVIEDDESMSLVDVLEDPGAIEPAAAMEQRELESYLRDAIALLPERQRLIVRGYFYQERTSQELASLLGVTESRISQLRTEALENLRLGIAAQYESEQVPEEGRKGRVARRREEYATAIGARSDWRERLSDAAVA